MGLTALIFHFYPTTKTPSAIDPITVKLPPRVSFPADITFLIADLKYSNKQGVKICEIQPASLSTFKGYDYVNSDYGLVPKQFCRFIKKFQKTGWYVFKDVSENKFKDILYEKRWYPEESLESLMDNPEFTALSKLPVKDPSNLRHYHGVLYARSWRSIPIEEFRAQHPGIVLIDAAVSPYKGDKLLMNQLLMSDERLKKIRPMWNCYLKHYDKELVGQIKRDIPTDIFVIKPLRSTRGKGVLIVSKEELGPTLEYILTENKEILKKNPDASFSHWARDTCDGFIIEEFAESDPVVMKELNNQAYDATMRVVFALIYHKKKIGIAFFGGYWKLPQKSLFELGTLTEKHRSYGHENNFSSVKPEIMQQVEEELKESMMILYHLMLESR